MSQQALSGIKVVEYTNTVGGAYAGKLLATAGAQVIRVEEPDGSNRIRNLAPFAEDDRHIEKSIMHLYCNPEKTSVTLDLNKEEGQEILRKLLAGADIFIKEGLPEWYDSRGIGWEALHKLNPKLVVGSLTPYGEVGPYRGYKANPLNIQYISGPAALYPHGTGDMEKAPTMIGGSFEEYDTGTILLTGVLAALFYQCMTGVGQYMPVSAVEAQHETDHTNVQYPVTGFYHTRAAVRNKLMSSLPTPCKDGYIAPFLVQLHEFNGVAKLIGHEEWINEDWFKNTETRQANYQKITDAMWEYCSTRTMKEISDESQKLNASLGPNYTPQYVVDEDEQFAARHFFTEMEHPFAGEMKYPGSPFKMSETPFRYEKPAPILGSGNEEVYGALGLDVKALKNAGVI